MENGFVWQMGAGLERREWGVAVNQEKGSGNVSTHILPWGSALGSLTSSPQDEGAVSPSWTLILTAEERAGDSLKHSPLMGFFLDHSSVQSISAIFLLCECSSRILIAS